MIKTARQLKDFYQLFNRFFGNSRCKYKKSVCRSEKEAHGKPCIRFFLNRKHCGRR